MKCSFNPILNEPAGITTISGQVSQFLNTAPGSIVSSHPAIGSIRIDKSPKVDREYEISHRNEFSGI